MPKISDTEFTVKQITNIIMQYKLKYIYIRRVGAVQLNKKIDCLD